MSNNGGRFLVVGHVGHVVIFLFLLIAGIDGIVSNGGCEGMCQGLWL